MSLLTAREQESLERAFHDMRFYPDKVIDWVRNHLTPEDVFPTDDLQSWAWDNGFTADDELKNMEPNTKPKLIQLPNGTWLDPRAISSVSYHPSKPSESWSIGEGGTKYRSPALSDRVVVIHHRTQDGVFTTQGLHEIIDFSSPQEATAARDDIARQVNEARG